MNTVFLNTLKLDGDRVIVKDGAAEGGGSSGGGGDVNPSAQIADVNFRDYDGTILHSFSKSDFLALSDMPELPLREGLICQGWNYEIDAAKEYVSKYGKLDIGATYITDDGKTRLYIEIAEKGRMTITLYFSQTVSDGVTIDWGDGSATQTVSGSGSKNASHAYAEVGKYTINLNPSDRCTLGLGHNTSSAITVVGGSGDYNIVYKNMLKAVEIGNNIAEIGGYTFYQCYSLESVVIPDNVTKIGNNAFQQCYSLASVVIPANVTSIGNSAFANCYSLTSLVIPDKVTSFGTNIFDSCYSLASVVISNNITSISNYAFQSCYSLASVVIPKNVTSIGNNAFYSCYGMYYYDFSQCTSVPTLGNSAVFTSISSTCKMIVPDDLYDTWIAATNWSSHKSKIVKASEFNG